MVVKFPGSEISGSVITEISMEITREWKLPVIWEVRGEPGRGSLPEPIKRGGGFHIGFQKMDYVYFYGSSVRMGHKVYILIPILLPYRYTVRGTRHLFERRMRSIYAATALRTSSQITECSFL